MGQRLSRPPEPTYTRNGRRESQSQRRQAKRDSVVEGLRASRTREKSPVQYRTYQTGLATSFDEAETPHRGPRPRSQRNKKGNPRSRPKRRETSETRPPSTRRTFSDGPKSSRHRNGQAEALQSKSKQGPQPRDRRPVSRHENPRQQRPRETKDCIICANERPLHRFPNRPPTTQCQHGIDVCRRCLRAWIQSEFSTKIWNEMNCPVCSLRLQHNDMREFAPSDVFRRYDKLSTRAVLEAIPGFTWCISKGCKSGHVHTAASNKFTCVACKKSHCTQHNVAWHKKETCREYDYRTNKKLKKQEELASKKMILETTKKCPGCKRSIEKSYGCDHMTCSRCKHEFCWQCLASYAKKHFGHVVHRVGCVHHDPDIVVI